MKKTNHVNRRKFLKSVPAGAAATLAVSSVASSQEATQVGYHHGVASGDPLQDRVIIWTRITPDNINHNGLLHVNWDVATDKNFNDIVSNGHIHTGQGNDYTAKADAAGLKAGQKYYFRFKVGDQISPIGETRTLRAQGMDEVRLAVVSCSNYPFGYFNAYKAVCDNGEFDAVLHLGDYIYDYQQGRYQSENAEKMGRLVDPPHEIVTISDYRRRYAQYRTDPDLQEIHRRFPFICAWDDHEFANNTYFEGAENHNPGEGDWHKRRAAANQAYFEWMPMREEQLFVSYRSFDFGDLVTLAMLDTRLIGRERGLTYGEDVIDGDNEGFHKRLETEERSMLGAPQERWLRNTLKTSKKSGVPWQILGQQIIMSCQKSPPVYPLLTDEEKAAGSDAQKESWKAHLDLGFRYNADAWDGYQPARKRVLDMLEEHAVNPIVVAGDTHCGWAHSLCHETGGKHYGAEFAVQGITSPGAGDNNPHADEIMEKYLELNDHMAYTSTYGRGYMTVTITQEASIADWYVVSDIESKNFTVSHKKSLRYKAGDVADGKVELEDIKV
ncbi:MAG: alkaline phosphatase [Kordiimonadaceae bacterium]|jgi:alkaline phosphatase D|nr:alkaline phosphatase [Kordiimonadaceae bacterium]MBT6031218.1 alkaline phosphatase [Kordiimonadaceae bacterium]